MSDLNADPSEERLDLRAYWHIIARWWWLLVLGGVGGLVIGFLLSSEPVPMYGATTKVLIEGGQGTGLGAPDLQANRQLAGFYSDLVETRLTLQRVVEALDLPYGAGELADRLEVTSPATFLEIRARDEDPRLAAAVANTTAEIFIEIQTDRQFAQIARFQASLTEYGILQDPEIIAGQVATVRNLNVLEEAIPVSSPLSSSTRVRDIMLATLAGLLLAGLAVFAIEYLDDKLRSPDDVKAATGLPVLGVVAKMRMSDVWATDDHQNSGPMKEAFGFVRTNLEFLSLAERGDKTATILVTSSGPSEGKTTTLVNLGLAIARGDTPVLLVDCDLRRPSLHRMFGTKSEPGLTNVILGESTLEDAVLPTSIPGLRILNSGTRPPDPTGLLGSTRMRELMHELRSWPDTIIVDSPPLLVAADAMVLTALVDGAVMVVDPRQTRKDVLKQAVQDLKQSGSLFAAVLLNKVEARGSGSYRYVNYRSMYAQSYYGVDDPQRAKSRLLSRLFQRGERAQARGLAPQVNGAGQPEAGALGDSEAPSQEPREARNRPQDR